MGYFVPLTCPECGAEVVHHNDGAVIACREAKATCRCVRCGREWLVVVELVRVPLEQARHDRVARRKGRPLHERLLLVRRAS